MFPGDIEEILYHENFDKNNLVTPVKVEILVALLSEAQYDEAEIAFLKDGFTNGFDLGYEGPMNLKITAPNLKFRGIGNEKILWNKIMKEVKQQRYAGPFKEPPFDYFIQSPIGLVSKDGGADTRLIFHLSYPRCKNSTSINANTPVEKCKVTYPDFNEAIQLCLQELQTQTQIEGQGQLICYVSKSNVKSAFRNLGIKKKQWSLLVMKAKSPIDNQVYWFFDKALPFGASISCSHYQRVSRAISHLVTYRTGKKTVGYLDDYIFIAYVMAKQKSL